MITDLDYLCLVNKLSCLYFEIDYGLLLTDKAHIAYHLLSNQVS